MKYFIFSLKYIFGAISIALLISSFYDYQIKENSVFIQNEINKLLPNKIEKQGVKITVNKLELTPYENNLKAYFDLNINSKLYNIENRTGYMILKEKYENNKIRLKIFDIHFDNLTFEEFVESTKEPVNNLKENIKNKVGGFLSKKLGTTEETNNSIAKDVENKLKEKIFNKEKFTNIIFDNIKQYDIKVYDLGIYGLFVKNINLNILDDDFDLEITLSTGIFGSIIGLILLFISLGREMFLFLIYIYQKFISKHKGYNCARGVVSEDYTCSSYVKKEFKENGLIAGINAWNSTKSQCKEDFETYKNNKKYYDDKRKTNNNSNNNYCDCSPMPCGGPSHSHHDACDCDVLPCN